MERTEWVHVVEKPCSLCSLSAGLSVARRHGDGDGTERNGIGAARWRQRQRRDRQRHTHAAIACSTCAAVLPPPSFRVFLSCASLRFSLVGLRTERRPQGDNWAVAQAATGAGAVGLHRDTQRGTGTGTHTQCMHIARWLSALRLPPPVPQCCVPRGTSRRPFGRSNAAPTNSTQTSAFLLRRNARRDVRRREYGGIKRC